MVIIEEYRELTSQEEADLEELLGRENAIQDAASFMENLSEELAQLDQSNIHALMGSEEQIENLMEYLEGGIAEVEKMEMRLTVYDELLSNVRDTMQKLGTQYSHILRQNRNLKALCDEVNGIIVSESHGAISLCRVICRNFAKGVKLGVFKKEVQLSNTNEAHFTLPKAAIVRSGLTQLMGPAAGMTSVHGVPGHAEIFLFKVLSYFTIILVFCWIFMFALHTLTAKKLIILFKI